MRLRTGIYGGSFNPIHNGHILLARKLLNLTDLDEIWFVVSPQNPLKSVSELLNDDKRLELVRMALENECGLVASDYEFHLPKPSYMWDTLQNLSHDYPDREFVLIIGADNWNTFNKWYHSEDIVKHYHIVIYPRKGTSLDITEIPDHVTMVEAELIDISSTQIRLDIKEGKNICNLVPKKVCEVIKRDGLYL